MKKKSVLILFLLPLALCSCGEKTKYRKAFNTVKNYIKDNGTWRSSNRVSASGTDVVGYKMGESEEAFYYSNKPYSEEQIEIVFKGYMPESGAFTFNFSAYEGRYEIKSTGYIYNNFSSDSTINSLLFFSYEIGNVTYYNDEVYYPFDIKMYQLKALRNLRTLTIAADNFFQSIGTDLNDFGFSHY